VNDSNGNSDRFLGMTKIQFMFVTLVVSLIAIVSSGANILYDVNENRDRIAVIRVNQAAIKANADQTERISCSISKLVAYVPALQFEGEPIANFIGWIESRKEMLEATKGHCTDEIEEIIEERVRLDQILLDELSEPKQ
jgi:hypothetical protein